MIHLIFGLHMYQPPTQTPEVFDRIKRESYLPLLKFINEHPSAYFNLDICASLLELAQAHGHNDLLDALRAAYEQKKINLVSSGCYHPIFPLIPPDMVERQIKLNNEVFRRVFGSINRYQKPLGIFPPEMSFSPDIIEPMKKTVAIWTVTEDIGYTEFYRESPPYSQILRHNDMYVFLRSNLWSCKIAFDKPEGAQTAYDLKRGLNSWFGPNDGYLCVWMDFETFGHHHGGLIQRFLAPFLNSLEGNGITLTSPEKLIRTFPIKDRIVPPCSWSTNRQDWQHRNYFPLWNNPDCDFHKMWWHLASLAYQMVIEDQNPSLLAIYDKAIYSCQTWQYAFNNKGLAGLGLQYFRDIIKQTEHPLRADASSTLRILEKLLSH
jgi:alpha-amylase/alpha-mannosidase (GH57 family)